MHSDDFLQLRAQTKIRQAIDKGFCLKHNADETGKFATKWKIMAPRNVYPVRPVKTAA